MVKTRLLSLLLRILKLIGIVIAAIFLLFGIVTWVVFEKKDEWLLNQLQSYIKESQSGQLEIGTIDLKLFRSFPDVTIELDSIDYFEHRDSVRSPQEHPILHADQLFVAIELLPLIREEVNVLEITLLNAQLNIFEYQDGTLNVERALANPAKVKSKVITKKVDPKPSTNGTRATEKEEKPGPPPKVKPSIQVDLQSIYLSDILMTWKSYANTSPTVILMKEVEADLFTEGKMAEAKFTSSYQVQALTIGDSEFPPGDLMFDADLRYEFEQQLLTIRESKIKYDIFSASISGTYAHLKKRMIDIQIDASSNDLELLSTIIKPEVIKQNPHLLKEGDIYVKGRVFGEMMKQPPQVDISFGVNDLDLQLADNLGPFQNIGFEGKFSSGRLRDYSQAVFEIKDLKGQLPGGSLKGQFRLNNFVEPYVKYKLDAQLKLDGYDEVFRIDFLKQLSGTISLQADFDGPFKFFAEHSMDSSRSSAIALDNLSFVVAKTNQMVSGLSGKIENRNNQSILQELSFSYGKNDVVINATIDNLVYFLFKRERNIIASGNLRSNQIFTKDFILDTLKTAYVQDRISNLSFDFQATTSANKDSLKSDRPDLAFTISNLSCKLDELPDLKRVDARGQFSQTPGGLKLDLHEFQANLPQGKVKVTGDLHIPEKLLWQFNARVKTIQFPWTYINELVAEIKEGKEPTAKNIPVKEMEMVTADLDLSAAIQTYPFDIHKLDVRNSRIHFSFQDSKPISVEKLNLALEELYFSHPENSGSLTGLKSTKGTVKLEQLSVPGLNKLDINMNITGAEDKLDIGFSSATQKAKSENGQLLLDISKKELDYRLRYAVQGASLEYFVQKYYKKKFMEGDIDYVLDIRTSGATLTQVKQNLAGDIEISGDSLLLYGVDIDNVLRKFEKSQNFNLTDLGAVIIAGPLGLAVTKGTDFVSLATINLDATQQTRIQTLLAKWKLENRQLSTEDVAFVTPKNRIAFDGRIDFARDSIPGLTIAVIDKEGCSLMDQKLHGKMGALKTGKLNITKTLLGSVTNFVNAVVGKDCKPAYTGRVKAPVQ